MIRLPSLERQRPNERSNALASWFLRIVSFIFGVGKGDSKQSALANSVMSDLQRSQSGFGSFNYPEVKRKINQLGKEKNIPNFVLDPYYLPNRQELENVFDNNSRESIQLWHFYMGREEGAESNEFRQFEVYTREYINALADYYAQRVEELGGTEDKPIRIAEIGAGNGKLTHYLKEALNQRIGSSFEMKAFDDGSWGIAPLYEVTKKDNQEMLKDYQPDIVISSWMPIGATWKTDLMKANVKEITMMGVPYAIGLEESTETDPNWYENILIEPDGTRHEYERVDLEGVHKHQLCHLDHTMLYDSNFQEESQSMIFTFRNPKIESIPSSPETQTA